MTQDDPVVDRVRAARRRIVAKCGGDPHKIYEWAKQMEERYKDRIVTYERAGPSSRQAKP
ncbi:MAG TPA: hypothetical protein VJZ71_03110 [Phycisphaerae bacterium]|nr:hypothetical protein [Phycisphaerae bacterium]